MRLDHLWLTDFRNYVSAEVVLSSGTTAVVGDNGQGKTNLLEAVGYLAELRSFRGADDHALVRIGAASAVVRAEGEREGRALLIEAELSDRGRNRAQINRQPLRRARDMLGHLTVTVFSPDDLAIIKGGPSGRRGFLDAAIVSSHPKNDRLRRDVDKILRQRNTLLKQAGGRLDDDVEMTLDVWDQKLASAGERLVAERCRLLDTLGPLIEQTYGVLSGSGATVTTQYRSSWLDEGLGVALAHARDDDLRRRVSTVGPHRDDIEFCIDRLPARTHASQGEQRSLALALRLGSHNAVTAESGSAPLLLLDDVFSELDDTRGKALIENLPPAQTLLTTAGPLPVAASPGAVFRVRDGTIVPG